MKKENKLNGLLRMKGRFVLNQKANVFSDKRTKRNKTRATQKQKALDEQN
jgi:hypothetical protein